MNAQPQHQPEPKKTLAQLQSYPAYFQAGQQLPAAPQQGSSSPLVLGFDGDAGLLTQRDLGRGTGGNGQNPFGQQDFF
jgi:hypothetical protein